MNPTDNANTSPTVVLTADAKPFERELDGALSKYRQWAGQIEQRAVAAGQKLRAQSVFKGMGEELDKVQKRFDGITSAALGFTVASKVADLATETASKIRDWVTGAANYAKALEKAAELNAKILAMQNERIARGKELTEAAGAGSPGARMSALEGELATTNAEAAKLAGALDRAKKASEDISTVWRKDAGNFRTWLGGGLEDARKEAAEQEKTARAAYEAIKAREKEITDALARLRNPLADPAKIAAVENMVAEFDKARLTLGATAENAKRVELELQGFDPSQIDKVMKSFGELEDSKRAQKVYDITKELQKQADTYGKTANEIKLAELAAEGFHQSQIDQVREQMRASEAIIAQKEKEMEFAKQVQQYLADELKIGESGLVGAQAGGTSSAANAIAAARADTARFTNATPEQKAEMTRQQQLREQVKATAELQKLVGQVAQLVSGIEGLGAV